MLPIWKSWKTHGHVCPLSGIKGSNYSNYLMLHQPGPSSSPQLTHHHPSSPHHLPKSPSLLIILNTHNPKQLSVHNLSPYPFDHTFPTHPSSPWVWEGLTNLLPFLALQLSHLVRTVAKNLLNEFLSNPNQGSFQLFKTCVWVGKYCGLGWKRVSFLGLFFKNTCVFQPQQKENLWR